MQNTRKESNDGAPEWWVKGRKELFVRGEECKKGTTTKEAPNNHRVLAVSLAAAAAEAEAKAEAAAPPSLAADPPPPPPPSAASSAATAASASLTSSDTEIFPSPPAPAELPSLMLSLFFVWFGLVWFVEVDGRCLVVQITKHNQPGS